MTTPYYADESVTLWHGDCREVTTWLDADVLVTDPPYGMAFESNRNRDRRNVKVGRGVVGDQDSGVRDAALALWGNRPALVFGTWRVVRPTDVRQVLIWHKVNSVGMGDLGLPWGPNHEDIYVLGDGFSGKRGSSVLAFPMLMSGRTDRPDHPTPKPVGLMEQLIEKCPPGVIADPFAGSGSTILAARNQGRRAIGVEVDERYCELIATRLSQGVLL